jgi:hypothetical protein
MTAAAILADSSAVEDGLPHIKECASQTRVNRRRHDLKKAYLLDLEAYIAYPRA